MGQCIVVACEVKIFSRRLCKRHYSYYKYHNIDLPAKLPKELCMIEGCVNPKHSKGFCKNHYQQQLQRKKQPTKPSADRVDRTCGVDGCSNKHAAKGFCMNHYQMNKRNGKPALVRRAPLKAHETLEDALRKVGWTVTENGCWEWLGSRTKRGYGLISAKKFGFYLAHRSSYHVFVGPIDNSLEIRHRCDNPPCMNPDHLLQGTHKENEADKLERGGRGFGEMSTTAKLTNASVLEIRKLYSTGEYLQKDLAELFDVSRATICNIVNNKYWSIDA